MYAGPSNPLQSPIPYDFGSGTGEMGTYELVYPQGIEIYGASFSGYLGESNVAGEISARRRMPLVSTALVATHGMIADGDKTPLYALGTTLHAQISSIATLAPNRFWDAANVSGEIAVNRRLDVTRNPGALDPGRDKFAASVRALFEPTFFAVAPGLDLSVPISMGYGLLGDSSIDAGQNARTGSIELGLSAVYRAAWRANLTLTKFIGDPSRQPFADRDFISLSIQTTF